jgi:hypothetical protein
MKIKKHILLIAALCGFNYTVKGAAATDENITQRYTSEGYKEEKNLYEKIIEKDTGSYITITLSTSSEELITIMKNFITLLETAHHFLTPEKNLILNDLIKHYFLVIFGTNQIETALLEGNKELLKILKKIDELKFERVVPISSASTFPLRVIGRKVAPIQVHSESIHSDDEQVVFKQPSHKKSSYFFKVFSINENTSTRIEIYNAYTNKRISRTDTTSNHLKIVASPHDGSIAFITDNNSEYITITIYAVNLTTIRSLSKIQKSKDFTVKESHFSVDGRTLIIMTSKGQFEIQLPQLPEYNSSCQQLLLNALEHKREADCAAVQLTPKLMELLAVLPPNCRPLLTRQGPCTVVFTTTNPRLTPSVFEEKKCAICIEDLDKKVIDGEDMGEQIFTRCGHSYHRTCITKVLRNEGKCPLCNTPGITTENLLSRFQFAESFAVLEKAVRTNPFITLPRDARQAITNFQKTFVALPAPLKCQLKTLQQELQKTLETAFTTPQPKAALAQATEEPIALVAAETAPVAVAQETIQQRRDRLTTAIFKRLQLQKPE